MKPKTAFYFAAIGLFAASLVLSQTYTEIFEGSWGQGRRFIRPCFTDLDNDGLLDLLLGINKSRIQHLEQDSPGSIYFSVKSFAFNGIDAGPRAAPTFTDLDHDGLLDLIIGTTTGTISHYEQDADGSTTFLYMSGNFNKIDIGNYATPGFTDFDHDGLLDLIIGEMEGTLNHYEQNSAGSEQFTLVTENFNGIDVGDISTICFTDLDDDDLIELLVGVNVGTLQHYEQVSYGSTEFDLVSENFNGIDAGAQACPVFTDLDHDGLADLFIGNMYGFLEYYEQASLGSANVSMISKNILPGIDIGHMSVPSFIDPDDDGLWDMVIGNSDGILHHFEQDAYGSPYFSFLTDSLFGIFLGYNSSPVFMDLDHDELPELIVGDGAGFIHHYEQETAGSMTFNLITDRFNDTDFGDQCTPAFTDLDADGLYDLIIGREDGTLGHYEQDEAASFHFTLVSDHFNDIDAGSNAKPGFICLNDDGLLDMIIGESLGHLYHYKQNAPGSSEFSLISENFHDIQSDGYSCPAFADINRDGLEDLLVGSEDGGIQYFQRNNNMGIEQKSMDPVSFGMISNYPNPFNSCTQIYYAFQKPTKVQIALYNLFGRQVRLFEPSDPGAGPHTISWDGTDEHGRLQSSGIYICRMQAGGYRKSIRVLLAK